MKTMRREAIPRALFVRHVPARCLGVGGIPVFRVALQEECAIPTGQPIDVVGSADLRHSYQARDAGISQDLLRL